MNTSNFLPLGRALVCGLALLGAPRIARSQPEPQPQFQQSLIKADREVVLPAQFTAVQFFDAMAKATNTRIVAPAPSEQQLAQLRQSLGGRQLTLQEITKQYGELTGVRLRERGSLIVGEGKVSVAPTEGVEARVEPLVQLLLALSREQLDLMYLRGSLQSDELTAEQRPLYLDALRKSGVFPLLPVNGQPVSDEQILQQQVRFNFAWQASMNLGKSGRKLSPMPVYDYGTGLVWNPTVPLTAPVPEKKVAARQHASAPSSLVLAPAPLEFEQTTIVTADQALDQIERSSGQHVSFGPSLSAQRLQATEIVISSGQYKPRDLLNATLPALGLSVGVTENVLSVNVRPAPPRLPPQIQRAATALTRLPPVSSQLPFFSSIFERSDVVPFAQLEAVEQNYVRARLLNENAREYDKFDLATSEVYFFNTLYFSAFTGGFNAPFVTYNTQLW